MFGDPDAPIETNEAHKLLPTDEYVVARETLRFRGLDEVTSPLTTECFELELLLGDWHGSPFRPDSTEIVVLARR